MLFAGPVVCIKTLDKIFIFCISVIFFDPRNFCPTKCDDVILMFETRHEICTKNQRNESKSRMRKFLLDMYQGCTIPRILHNPKFFKNCARMASRIFYILCRIVCLSNNFFEIYMNKNFF